MNKNIGYILSLLFFISSDLQAEIQQKPTITSVVEQFIALAHEQQLAQEPAWLNLLHYKINLSGRRHSQADDAEFFLSAAGAVNPQAELEADIRGFLAQSAPGQPQLQPQIQYSQQHPQQHPQCRFPARLHWLNSRLHFADKLPQIRCQKFIQWKQSIVPTQLTLLFPSMHLDNPASMFGHIFLRLDEAGKNHLLNQTLSYAAAFDESDSLLMYSWKGVTGGYTGRFFMQPYYETLLEYSDIEQRDIWEYKLNLNQQEIDQLLRHLWEIREIHFDYYFLRENCAFRLLALLDVARENINMSLDSHPLYAVPVDVVRDIELAGLVNSRHYRPSTHNRVSQMMRQLDKKTRQSALLIVNGQIALEDLSQQLNTKQHAQALQLADEILTQQKKPSVAVQQLQFEILSERSHLPVTADDLDFKFAATPPELSHPSARWQFSLGEHERQRFYGIGIRPTFHDLLDIKQGFINGAEINMLDARFRWYETEEKLKLESLDIFSMRSIVAVKPWVTPLSRQLSVKLVQRDVTLSQQITELESQFALGYAAELGELLVYAMANGQLEYATELENNYALLVGLESGLLMNFKQAFLSGQTSLSYKTMQQVAGEAGDIESLVAGIQVNMGLSQAIRLSYEYTDYQRFDVTETEFSYILYF